MGIILEKSKLIFDELIGANSFDEIFKNSIRDYYTYGFKSYDQFSKGVQTVNDRWKILSKILGEKWYLEKRKNGRNQIIMKTMPIDTSNPIDDFYFLHNLSKIGDYLNYLLDLDVRSVLRGGASALPVNIDELITVQGSKGVQELINVDEVEYAIVDNWINNLDNPHNNDMPVRINRQMNIWSSNTRFMPGSYKDKYDNLSTRTEYLYALGILGDLRADISKRNAWLSKQWVTYDSPFNKCFNSKSSGNHFWYKSPLTLSELVESQNESERIAFIENFQTMCEFFSQYYPLGELGTLLAKRCSKKIGAVKKSKVFRFKHNYLQKSLYDYNLIDLLLAIENNYTCLIRYVHGTSLRAYEELAVPLEIRISVMNGREYLLYYQVLEKRIKALRLEFIDKITMYAKISSIEKVQRTIIKEGKKKSSKVNNRQKIYLDRKELDNQLNIAREMLPYIWGTGVNDCAVDDDWRERLISFMLPVSYDFTKEQYIKSRIRKEGRNADHNHSIEIFPTAELKKWIRSFYLRVDDSDDLQKIGFNILDDVDAMWNVYFGKKCLLNLKEERTEYSKEKDTEDGYIIKGEVVDDLEGHGALFNELFSWYSIALANTVLDVGNDKRKQLKDNLRNVLDYYTEDELDKVADELYSFLLDTELIDREGNSRFLILDADYLYDLLPLSKAEVRWLMTVLEDPLAAVFLTMEQIHSLKGVCRKAPFHVKKFHLDAINYFDRFKSEEIRPAENNKMGKRQCDFLKRLYVAIKENFRVQIVYRNWKGEKKYVICFPAWIEYSARDDVFRLWYAHNKAKQIRKINIPRILSIEVLTDKRYNLCRQQELTRTIINDTMDHIQIEFYQGTKNLPDRILTEFSLWEKKCVYDVLTEKYTLTLYYSTMDEKEIMVRLLGFGPYIRILAKEDNYILNEVKKRIIKQKERIICT